MLTIVYYNPYECKPNFGGRELGIIMEGTPFIVESSSEDDKEDERKKRIKKPETFGILAMEADSEKERELSPLEKAIAATRRPKPEAETTVVPETEPPVDRVPEENARRIVHEMVAARRKPEAPQAEEEPPQPEETPIETVSEEAPKPPEKPPVETPKPPKPEAPPVETAAAEAPPEKPPKIPEVEPPAARVEDHNESEEAPAEHIESAPVQRPEAPPAAAAEEAPEPPEKPETPPDDDKKKPGVLSSLFRRRGRDKSEKAPEEDHDEEPEAAAPPPPRKKAPEGPKFQFNERTPEAPEEPAEAPEVAAEEDETPKAKKPEQLGRVLLSTEAEPVDAEPEPVAEAVESSMAAEEKMKVEAAPTEHTGSRNIETLSRSELLQMSEKIEINGSNLRHIYETHLIGEHGLRRLVAEHLRGGDLPKALRREVTEHEIDFERDPMMRDHRTPAAAAAFDNASNAALEQLLKKADVSMEDNGEQTAVLKAQARHEEAAEERQSHHRRLLDITLATTITFLIVLIIIIFLIRV